MTATNKMPAVGAAGGWVGNGGGRATVSVHDDTPGSGARQVVELHGANGRVVATVRNGALCKQIHGSKHFLRKPAGIAFDLAVLQQAHELAAGRVWVRDRETSTVYTTTLQEFWEHGVKLDRGFGDQLCLPFAFWHAETPGAPRQLALW